MPQQTLGAYLVDAVGIRKLRRAVTDRAFKDRVVEMLDTLVKVVECFNSVWRLFGVEVTRNDRGFGMGLVFWCQGSEWLV